MGAATFQYRKMSSGAANGRIATLEAGRGIAALLVLLSHTSDFLAVPKYFDARPLGGVFDFGFVGVDYFFALSGFVIYYTNHRAIGRRGACGPYARLRIALIYPIYSALSALLAIAYLALPVSRTGEEFLPWSLFTSVTLLPGGTTLVPTGWSLVHEVLFYIAFAVLLARPRAGMVLFAAWFAATVAVALAGGTGVRFLDTVFYVRTLHFGFGMLAAWLFCADRVAAPALWIGLGATGLLALWSGHFFGEFAWPTDLLYVALGIASTLLLTGLAEAERSVAIRTPAALVFLGAASYAVYLVHYPVALVLTKALKAVSADTWMSPVAVFIVLSGVTLVISLAAHIFVERPLLSAARRLLVYQMAQG